MIYPQLYRQHAASASVRVGLIGTGHYGSAIVTQSMAIANLHVSAVADRNVEAAQRVFELAGVPKEDIAVCGTRAQALAALPGKRVIVEDPLLLMDLPVDIIAEATGMPEAGALHAVEAIRHGKHVAMISKEPDSVVGPYLKHLADRAGLVYTAVDGDQHGLLIGLVGWLRSLGLDVLCAGKSRDAEFVYEPDYSSAALAWDPNSERRDGCATISLEDRVYLDFIPEGRAAEFINARRRIFSSLRDAGSFDYCESVIAANATGLAPDLPAFHRPILRVKEIPEVLCPISEGGILRRGGIIDLVTCLRGEHEAGLGGGVFAVVGCENEHSRRVLITKGLIANRRRTSALVVRPHHLCGVETPTTLLCAALLGIPTGTDTYAQNYDLILTTTRPMQAGEILNCEHDASLQASIVPGLRLSGAGPLPAHLGTGRALTRDLPAGTVITEDAVEIPEDSFLLSLRKQQDAL